jgi:surfeit locus 1 family protein
MRGLSFAILIGLAGTIVLLSLGIWQLRRLAWKEGIIAEAEAMLAAEPVALPAAPDPGADRYRAVRIAGAFTGAETFVLTGSRDAGPGFLVVAAFGTDDGRTILVDRGFVPEAQKSAPRPARPAEITGNLNWPDDVTSSTPPYDADLDIWYGRDVAGIAAHLGTEPVLVIARSDTRDGVVPQPVSTAGVRNDHLEYAITWFSLAAIWVGMTAYFLWRIRRRPV